MLTNVFAIFKALAVNQMVNELGQIMTSALKYFRRTHTFSWFFILNRHLTTKKPAIELRAFKVFDQKLIALYQTACTDNSRLLLKTGQQFGQLRQAFYFNQQFHIGNTIGLRDRIDLPDINLIRENDLGQVFQETSAIIGLHHNLYTLPPGWLHFPVRFYCAFRFLINHAHIVRTSHLMNAYPTVQGNITCNRLTMHWLTALRNMQFYIIQTIDQNPVR